MNRDIELYGLIPDGQNSWCIIDEENSFTISNIDIKKICENLCNKDYIEEYSTEKFIEYVWEDFRDNHCPDIVDYMYTENWDKFTAWFDYICARYLTNEIVSMYKQRLLDFE